MSTNSHASGDLQPASPRPWLQTLRAAMPSNTRVLLGLVALGTLIFFITAFAMTSVVDGMPRYVTALFALAILITITLSIVIIASLVDIFRSARAGRQGARLHSRLVGILSLAAAIPAVVAFALSTIVLQAFSDEYFVDRVTEANAVARGVANGYADAVSQRMGLQVVQLDGDLRREAQLGLTPENAPIGFRKYLLGQAIARSFSAIILIDESGVVVSEVLSDPATRYRLPPKSAFDAVNLAAETGAVPYRFAAHDNASLDGYYALWKQSPPGVGYIVAYTDESPILSQELVRVREFRDEAAEVRARLGDLSVSFAVGYGLVMLLLLLGATWIGLLFANAIVNPVRRLATAAEAVSSGDLSSRVEVRRGDDELGDLGRTFNEMTRQLEGQRADLVATNAQSEARRRFIETVISGVPAGVLNVGRDGRIALANPAAQKILLPKDEGSLVGQTMTDVAPSLGALIERANEAPQLDLRDQIELHRAGAARIINVQIVPDDPEQTNGYVVTLDDITELVSAQRNAAWGDVARRIAHEIKNPLTPIQLSAERLKRKYGKTLGEDRDIFDRCTDTIIRHVGDIGRMVNEFSSFARMPEPVMARENLNNIVREASFSFSVAHPAVTFLYDLPTPPAIVSCDGRLIGQAVINLVKNAVESIAENPEQRAGKILLRVTETGESAILEVLDNGRGLPTEGRARLTEPYMTTRARGTGLGLAIVRKATEEHGGTFTLLDRGIEDGPGATARISLPRVASVSLSGRGTGRPAVAGGRRPSTGVDSTMVTDGGTPAAEREVREVGSYGD